MLSCVKIQSMLLYCNTKYTTYSTSMNTFNVNFHTFQFTLTWKTTNKYIVKLLMSILLE